jgi:hypothetical protein
VLTNLCVLFVGSSEGLIGSAQGCDRGDSRGEAAAVEGAGGSARWHPTGSHMVSCFDIRWQYCYVIVLGLFILRIQIVSCVRVCMIAVHLGAHANDCRRA